MKGAQGIAELGPFVLNRLGGASKHPARRRPGFARLRRWRRRSVKIRLRLVRDVLLTIHLPVRRDDEVQGVGLILRADGAVGRRGQRRGVAGACRRARAGAPGGPGEDNQQGDEGECGRQRDPVLRFHGFVSLGEMGMKQPCWQVST